MSDKIFLHFCLRLEDGRVFEWGFNECYVPAVGDKVWLGMKIPGSDDSDGLFLNYRVISREWSFSYTNCGEGSDAWIELETNEEIPDGYKADSESWTVT